MKARGFVGLLQRGMYGTQDASRLWQNDYTALLVAGGFTPGVANPALLYSSAIDARILVHGDDFVVLGDVVAQEAVEKMLRSRYTVKKLGCIGEGAEMQELVVLNRIVRHVPAKGLQGEAMEMEADLRHAEVLLRQYGLDEERTKKAETPRAKKTQEQAFADAESEVLSRQEATAYRSATMRLSYMAQDRGDLQEATKCLAQNMKEPRRADVSNLKRVLRYLKGRPRAVLRFEEQEMPATMEAWVDSDHAGDPVTRRSTTGLVVKLGRHVLKTSSTVQEPRGLSSGESEYYAAVRGAAVLLGMRSLLEDLAVGVKVRLRLKTDSSAAQGFASRKGLGRMRHVSTRYLWLQDKVADKTVEICKVGTKEQLADFLTKPVPHAWVKEKLEELAMEFREGRAVKQKEALCFTETNAAAKTKADGQGSSVAVEEDFAGGEGMSFERVHARTAPPGKSQRPTHRPWVASLAEGLAPPKGPWPSSATCAESAPPSGRSEQISPSAAFCSNLYHIPEASQSP